jgi:NADPH:quinone reductase-like Zn-dependent oxidoreductase
MLTRGSGSPNWLKLAWDYLRTPRFNPLDMINENKNVMAFNLSYLFEERELLRAAFTKILGWYEERQLRLPQVEEFSLSEAAAAHKALQSGATMGKLVLVPQGAPRSGLLPEQKAGRLVQGKA